MEATSKYLNQPLRTEAEYRAQVSPVAVPELACCKVCKGTGKSWVGGVAYSWSRKSGYEKDCFNCGGRGEV